MDLETSEAVNLEAEVEQLRKRVAELEADEQRRRDRLAWFSRGATGALTRVVAGPAIHKALVRCWDAWSRWLREQRTEPWPEEPTRDLLAALASGVSRRVFLGLLLASLPALVILWQTFLLSRQTDLLSAQNEAIRKQTDLLLNQLSLQQEANVALYPEDDSVQGSSGRFELAALNLGTAEVADVSMVMDYYAVNVDGSGRINTHKLMAASQGTGGFVVSTRTPRLPYQRIFQKGDGATFNLLLPSNYPEWAKASDMLFVRVTLEYARVADGKKYRQSRLYHIRAYDHLLDVTERSFGEGAEIDIINQARLSLLASGEV